jgi:hypothetical protein
MAPKAKVLIVAPAMAPKAKMLILAPALTAKAKVLIVVAMQPDARTNASV